MSNEAPSCATGACYFDASKAKVAPPTEANHVNPALLDATTVVPAEDLSDAFFRAKLSAEQYHVLRKSGTERAFTGEYWDNHDKGIFLCRACNLPLFSSQAKFDSGTGWPSFYDAVDKKNIKTERDDKFGMVRVEAMCNHCDSHLGHIFDDGPRPTGLRYCINSASIKLNKQH
ncbi:peptide methionine sulfoxide reductase [Capsaspora owczarzaki ATCC 30864]|uniref:Peptide-methionine (R)-S-oxide reductase n=1 Tax=Capsaspora owczarzaki (strain ATCC 30864) TaxID=595528 RepID=A0A0D2ULW9_CAPO3|nr:peptide methionine sulfoxide reductase [Capsaspora owczarzaki ATCC 30864]KJE96076.1 peptide methionine sulfoxide reductase [Capsaspora owczarzaki ATCC 30864]|eukprot:XP_004345197.1 peptide methionine sulfoxide reductase [Capsaspora owczarzaki ATCC 30864]